MKNVLRRKAVRSGAIATEWPFQKSGNQEKRDKNHVMFTAFVLLCAQDICFAVGGPSFSTENECIADFMQNGVIALQLKYPTHTIQQVKCYEWEKRIGA